MRRIFRKIRLSQGALLHTAKADEKNHTMRKHGVKDSSWNKNSGSSSEFDAVVDEDRAELRVYVRKEKKG